MVNQDPSLAIAVEALGKQYDLGERQARGRRISEALAARLLPGRRHVVVDHATIWALRDVNFAVRHGEVLGLVGGNGAGKSTLLKILSRITTPTEGRAVLDGRVGSLLEVGTGFHPELTGRENAMLNGAILGMSRAEVLRRLPDIVDFSEIGRFLDTPVKRYSSGMHMRLAFAVAAFLDTEILLVDEVLAVGDLAFQQRCLGKMGDISHSGRTVIFVSHNLGAVTQLCRSAIWLAGGSIRLQGPVEDVVSAYTGSLNRVDGAAVWQAPIDADVPLRVARATLGPPNATPSPSVECDDGLEISIEVDVHEEQPGASVAFLLRNSRGVVVVSSDLVHADVRASEQLRRGRHRYTITLPSRLLAPDHYRLTVIARSAYHGEHDEVVDACGVDIVDLSSITGPRRTGVIGYNLAWRPSALSATPDD